MPSITKATAKLHCRTCLVKVNMEPEEIQNLQTDIQNIQQNESKDICISILKNKDLENFIRKYILSERSTELKDEYPKSICLDCFNKLQQADKFLEQAKLSEEKLFALFETEKSDENQFQEEDDINIYKLLLKDTLMETESVLLDHSTTPSLINIEVNHPDPFETNNEKQIDQSKTSPENSETSDNSSNAFEWEQNSLNSVSSDQQNVQRQTRSSSKLLTPTDTSNAKISNENLTHSKQQSNYSLDNKELNYCETNENVNTDCEKDIAVNFKRKKRRTKKEMEEHRHKVNEKREGKSRRRQKGSKNTFKCTQCNHSFAHKITLDAHVRKIHQGSKRPFQCDRCEKSYTFIGGLYTHIKEIHEAEVRSYSCDFPNCDRIYTSFIAMQKHKRLKHTDSGEQKKYVCEQCGATFNQTGNLRYHRRIKHPTEAEMAEKEKEKERFECLICKKLFHSRYTLKYHTLQLHTNETKFECNVCGRKMAKKFMLVQHMLVHSTEKMPCEHCGKQFIRKFELEAHIRAVHMKLKPFECQYCTECFASRKTLRHHEYIHTGEKPYVCDLCGQAYRQQTCLKNHRKSHEKATNEVLLGTNVNQSLMNVIQQGVSSLTDSGQGTTMTT